MIVKHIEVKTVICDYIFGMVSPLRNLAGMVYNSDVIRNLMYPKVEYEACVHAWITAEHARMFVSPCAAPKIKLSSLQ